MSKELGKEPEGIEVIIAIFRPKLNSTLETLLVEDIEDFVK